MARALPSTMFSTDTRIHLFVLLPRYCSWFQSCSEVWGKAGEIDTLICCAVSNFQSNAVTVLIVNKAFRQLELEVDVNWAHQYSALVYFHTQVPLKRKLALTSLCPGSKSRNNVQPFQIEAFRNCV